MTFAIEPQSLVAQILGEMNSKERAEFWKYNPCIIAVTAENISALLDFISEYLFSKTFVDLDYLSAEKSMRFFLLQVLQSIDTPNKAREIYRSISGSTVNRLKRPPKENRKILLLVTAKVYENKRMPKRRKIKNAMIILGVYILKLLQ